MTFCNRLTHHIVTARKDEPRATFVVKVFNQLYFHNMISLGIKQESHVYKV